MNSAFNLLYNHLVLFHEVAGRALFGNAWHGRRVECLRFLPVNSRVLDLGAGEGRIVREATRRCMSVVGVEPSNAMRRAALRRGIRLLEGSSNGIPLPDGSIDSVVITYPGNWILAAATWNELARVCRSTAMVVILLGGSFTDGDWTGIRTTLSRIVYGDRAKIENVQIPEARAAGYEVETKTVTDDWGEAIIVIASREPV